MAESTLWGANRKFFSSLRWDYSQRDLIIPVFLPSEIKNVPLRWLKNILLERVGLTTKKELDNTIHRFSIKEISKAEDECYLLFEELSHRFGNILIIAKIVFFDQTGGLPTYQIRSTMDIQPAFKFAEDYSSRADELWLCWASEKGVNSNYSGRITFPIEYSPNILEIVWYGSPRIIEEFQENNFPYPFARAHKESNSQQFIIDHIYIPDRYSFTPNIRTRIIKEIQWALISIHRYQEAIKRLKTVLYGAGVKEVCLEFIVRSGKLAFTDWDTEIETSL